MEVFTVPAWSIFFDAGLFMSPWPWILWCATSCVYDPNILWFQIMIIELIGKKNGNDLIGVFLCNNTGCKLQNIVVWCLKRNDMGWVRSVSTVGLWSQSQQLNGPGMSQKYMKHVVCVSGSCDPFLALYIEQFLLEKSHFARLQCGKAAVLACPKMLERTSMPAVASHEMEHHNGLMHPRKLGRRRWRCWSFYC